MILNVELILNVGFLFTKQAAVIGHRFIVVGGGTGVRKLTTGLVTLPPKVDPGAFSGQRQGWKPQEDPLAVTPNGELKKIMT